MQTGPNKDSLVIMIINARLQAKLCKLTPVLRLVCGIVLLSLLIGCTASPPDRINNACHIFKQYKKWYWASQEVKKKWGVPISVQLAIIHQESKFRAKAKPPRTKLLWIIPWTRPTSAYGYGQALDDTWENYIKQTGNSGADRDDYPDVADFIGWYANVAARKCGISKADPYNLYLVYHEGFGGYQRGTYNKKAWLIKVAKKVERQAWRYDGQLRGCQASLEKKPWYRFW